MDDLTTITAWWQGLTDDDGDRPFLAVSPPDEDRMNQGELHEDAAEEAADAGLPQDTDYAGWHWHSHEQAFHDGALVGPLHIHFAGDPARIAEVLASVPEGFAVAGGEAPNRAFVLTKSHGLEELDLASDEAGRIAEGIARGFEHASPAEWTWLHTFVQCADADDEARFVAITRLGLEGRLTEDDMRAWVRDGFPFESDVDEASERAAQFVEAGGRDIVAPAVEEWLESDPDEVDGWLLSLWEGDTSARLLLERAKAGRDVEYLLDRAAADRGVSREQAGVELGGEHPELRDVIAKELRD